MVGHLDPEEAPKSLADRYQPEPGATAMKNRSGIVQDVQHSTHSASTTAGLGPRTPGTVYDNASGIFEVRAVVTDHTEARRILKRHSARFAVLVRDLHAGTEHYTGAVWTGSDRVLKAVA